MGKFFAELKRRHVYRVGAAYAVVAWVLLQLVNNVAPMLGLPAWAGTLVLVLLLVGFPVALIFAWTLELKAQTADGAPVHAANTRMDFVLSGALAVVIGLILYQQLSPAPGARTVQQAGIAAPPAGGISIAVLPFANVSGDTGQDFFSDGMTDEITLALAKVPDLHVVARTSAYEFKGQNRNIRAIGQALGASHLIEGSVRKMGDRVRITVELVRADNGLQLWSDGYDRQLTDIFATQEDIAQAIANALKMPLGLKQGDTLVRDRTKDLESYDQYLRAKAFLRTRGTDVTRAIDILEQAVAHDPGFAPAWALLAKAYLVAPFNRPEGRTGTPEEITRLYQSSYDKSEKAAGQAIRLDSRNAVGYAVLSRIQAERGKWAIADDLFKQALALEPNEPDVLESHGGTLVAAGRLKEALAVRARLRALEPLVPIYNQNLASSMQFVGQNRASIPILEAIPADTAGGYNRNVDLARAYAAEGRYAEAADTLLAMRTDLISRQSVEDAARILRSAPTKVAAPETLPAFESSILSFVYAYVGAYERFLERLEVFRDRQMGYATSMNTIWLPVYAPARKTERFKAFVRSAGLVDYWRERGWPDLCRPVGNSDFVCD